MATQVTLRRRRRRMSAATRKAVSALSPVFLGRNALSLNSGAFPGGSDGCPGRPLQRFTSYVFPPLRATTTQITLGGATVW
jgi:hypothetical protein